MPVKHAMLGLLAGGQVHGYDLKADFERDLAPSDRLNFGQVYSTLDRLRRDGLVTHAVVPQAERPDRKVYSLTESGTRELREWLERPTPIELDLRNETFLKLMVARRLDWADPMQVVATERRACFERLHEFATAKTQANRDGAPVQTVLLLELAILRVEAIVKWLERCEEVLNEESKEQ